MRVLNCLFTQKRKMSPISVLVTFLMMFPFIAVASAEKGRGPKTAKEQKTSWTPTPFDDTIERLPIGYTGVSPRKFVDLFKSKIVEVKKEEFETFDEYAARLERTERILPPLNRSDAYAFVVESFPIGSYSADSGAYFPGSSNFQMCRASKIDYWLTCRVAILGKLSKKYVASNAFGASIVVADDYISYFSVAVRSDSSFIRTMFRQRRDDYLFGDRLEVDIAKAKLLQGAHISLLLVGKIADHMMVPAQIDRLKADFNAPADYLATEEAVPITVRALYYYVKETGEILKTEKFD